MHNKSMETNFSQIVLKDFRSDNLKKDLSLLSDKLLIVADAVDNQHLNDDEKKALIHELRLIRSEYIKSTYELKWDALRLISQMETFLSMNA